MANLFSFGFVRKRIADGNQEEPNSQTVELQPEPSVEDSQQVINSLRTSTVSGGEAEPHTKRLSVTKEWVEKKLKTYSWLRFDKGEYNFCYPFFIL